MPTAQSRPRYKARPLAALPSFHCECGTTHNAADGKLPVGWTQSAGTVFCADCTRQGVASRMRTQANTRCSKVRLRGEVIELLAEGQRIMPLGAKGRSEWVQRVNTLLADVGQGAA